MTETEKDIHQQLRDLLDREHATYRVIEHPPEGRTETIAQIRGNRIEQSIKSIVVQVRLSRKENIYCLANVPGNCRIDFEGIKRHFQADSVAFAAREGTGVDGMRDRGDPSLFVQRPAAGAGGPVDPAKRRGRF